MKILSVVIPVYYNAASLPLLYDEIATFETDLGKRQLGLELIFVNDGSQDTSLEELLKIREQRPSTKVICHTRNFGAVCASKTGLKFVTGDSFIVQAADLQDPVAQILPMVDRWIQGDKFVISLRSERSDPLFSRAFSWIYYKVIKFLVLPDFPPGGFDLMLADKELLPQLRDSDKHVNTNMLAFSLGYKPTVLHYVRRKRLHGQSRWTFRKKLNYLIDTVTGFSAAPIRIISSIGLAAAIVSFLYGIHMIIEALGGVRDVPGFITIVVLVSFFSGLILTMLGVIGEYVWRIFELVSRKPESVIDRTYL